MVHDVAVFSPHSVRDPGTIEQSNKGIYIERGTEPEDDRQEGDLEVVDATNANEIGQRGYCKGLCIG